MPNYSSYPDFVCEDIVRLRRRIALGGVPEKRTDANLIIATWNIAGFGNIRPTFDDPEDASPARHYRGLVYIAEVCRHFDVIAIQEVKRDLTGLRTLVEWLGPDWGFIVSDVSGGAKGNTERLAYVFDLRRIKPSGLAGELVLPTGEDGLPVEQFDRTPYAVSFKIAEEEFILVTVHIRWGNEGEVGRLREVGLVAEWLADWNGRQRFHQDIIVLGDFNIAERHENNILFNAFASQGLNVPVALRDVPSTTGSAPKHYDQIGWFMGQLQMVPTGRAGSVPFAGSVLRDLKPSQLKSRVSDHLPLWVEFSIDRSEQYLGAVLGIDPTIPPGLGAVGE